MRIRNLFNLFNVLVLAGGVYACGDEGAPASSLDGDVQEIYADTVVQLDTYSGSDAAETDLGAGEIEVSSSNGFDISVSLDYNFFIDTQDDTVGGTDVPDVPPTEDTAETEVFDCERGATINGGDVTHYPVEGDTCEEAKQSIYGGREFAGECNCSLHVRYSVGFRSVDCDDRKLEGCEAYIDNVINETHAIVDLPHWEGCDPCFDTFYQNLVVHEQEHVDYCNEAGADLTGRTQNLPPERACAETEDVACDLAYGILVGNADAAFQDVLNDLNQRDDQYDADTNHGETQGATLNCDC